MGRDVRGLVFGEERKRIVSWWCGKSGGGKGSSRVRPTFYSRRLILNRVMGVSWRLRKRPTLVREVQSGDFVQIEHRENGIVRLAVDLTDKFGANG